MMGLFKTRAKENESKGTLPKTRKEQFILLFKTSYMKMVIFSMIAFLFIVPCIAIFLTMNYQTSLLLKQEGADKAGIVFSSCLFFSLYSLPVVSLIGLGSAGLFSVMKGFVYDEQVSYSSFFLGIKKNFKMFLFIAYFVYLFFVAFLLSFARFYYLTAVSSVIRYGIIFLSGVVFLIVFAMSMYMCTAAVRYECSFKELLANAFKLTFHKLYLNLLFASIILAIWAVAVVCNVIAQMIVFLLMFVYLLSFFALFLTSYHASIYDEFVNKVNFPAVYRAGLSKDSD